MAYKVLIVDDEEIVCRGLTQFVKWQEHGFQAAGSANSVEEALLQLEHMEVAVIFLDIRMPGKTGLDMLQILQQSYPGIKTVILSGFSEFSYAREAIRYGAVDYLSKPVNLQEVETLLDRLKAEFEKEGREKEIRDNRIEGLLISVVKGVSEVEQEKYQLPSLESWYGFSARLMVNDVPDEEIGLKKEALRKNIKAIVPDAYVLDQDVYGIFAVIPCSEGTEAEKFAVMLEQTCRVEQEWACGLSKYKHGVRDLREGYQEAEYALRYRRAREKRGIVWYKNIETLYAQSAPEVPDIVMELTGKLMNPEERAQAAAQMELALENICMQRPVITRFQTTCIRCLIEMNSMLESIEPKGLDLHGQLNKVLENILFCSDYKTTIACMTDYVRLLASGLDGTDEKQLGKGVIREIQLFIRKNYSKNITLNMLAEQFYLHPNYLSRLFKEKTGKNFVEYMTEIRMEQVKKLLENPENRIADISIMVGYDNTRYFNKVFKQSVGMTPSEYRERLLKNEG